MALREQSYHESLNMAAVQILSNGYRNQLLNRKLIGKLSQTDLDEILKKGHYKIFLLLFINHGIYNRNIFSEYKVLKATDVRIIKRFLLNNITANTRRYLNRSLLYAIHDKNVQLIKTFLNLGAVLDDNIVIKSDLILKMLTLNREIDQRKFTFVSNQIFAVYPSGKITNVDDPLIVKHMLRLNILSVPKTQGLLTAMIGGMYESIKHFINNGVTLNDERFITIIRGLRDGSTQKERDDALIQATYLGYVRLASVLIKLGAVYRNFNFNRIKDLFKRYVLPPSILFIDPTNCPDITFCQKYYNPNSLQYLDIVVNNMPLFEKFKGKLLRFIIYTYFGDQLSIVNIVFYLLSKGAYLYPDLIDKCLKQMFMIRPSFAELPKMDYQDIIDKLRLYNIDYDKYKNNILLYAARNNNYNYVNFVLSRGDDIHFDNDHPLREASKYYREIKYTDRDLDEEDDPTFFEDPSNDKTVGVLLENGADVHANNDESLKNAFQFGSNYIIKILLNANADPYVLEREQFLRIFHINPNIRNGELFLDILNDSDVEAINIAIENHVNLNTHDGEPLYIAFKNNDMDLFKHLLDSGANPGIADNAILRDILAENALDYLEVVLPYLNNIDPTQFDDITSPEARKIIDKYFDTTV
jgi:ankyrin repeat protein